MHRAIELARARRPRARSPRRRRRRPAASALPDPRRDPARGGLGRRSAAAPGPSAGAGTSSTEARGTGSVQPGERALVPRRRRPRRVRRARREQRKYGPVLGGGPHEADRLASEQIGGVALRAGPPVSGTPWSTQRIAVVRGGLATGCPCATHRSQPGGMYGASAERVAVQVLPDQPRAVAGVLQPDRDRVGLVEQVGRRRLSRTPVWRGYRPVRMRRARGTAQRRADERVAGTTANARRDRRSAPAATASPADPPAACPSDWSSVRTTITFGRGSANVREPSRGTAAAAASVPARRRRRQPVAARHTAAVTPSGPSRSARPGTAAPTRRRRTPRRSSVAPSGGRSSIRSSIVNPCSRNSRIHPPYGSWKSDQVPSSSS